MHRYIRDIQNFPKAGILFRDITPLLQNADTLAQSIDQMADYLKDVSFDLVVSPEARGFIFGMPIAYKMHKGFVPVRKPGKLPYKCMAQSYDLEYGSNTIEMHEDAIQKGQKVVIVDDLLATGGTTKAMIELIEKMGATVERIVFLIELADLNGRTLLKDYKVDSILRY